MPVVIRSLALSLTVVTVLGVAPAASAAPQHPPGRVTVAAPGTDVPRLRNRVTAAVQATLTAVAQKQSLISDSDLADDAKYSLLLGVRYDEQALAALLSSAEQATSVAELQGYADDLRTFYPRVYDVAVAFLDKAATLQAVVAANDTELAQVADTYADRDAAVAANDAARAALAAAADLLTDPTARGGRTTADGLRGGLATARERLREVRRLLVREHRFVRLRNRVTAEAEAKKDQLSRIADEVSDSGLSDEAKAAFWYSIERNGFALADLQRSAEEAPTLEALLGLADDVDHSYPRAFDVAFSTLVEAPALQARIERNRVALAAVSDRDVSVGVVANDAAAARLTQACSAAWQLVDDADRAGAAAVRIQVDEVRDQLRLVARVLGAGS